MLQQTTTTNTTKQTILNLVENRFKSSGGNCGLYVVDILQQLNTNYGSIKPIIDDLKQENKILFVPGHHGTLIFLNAKKPKTKYNNAKRN